MARVVVAAAAPRAVHVSTRRRCLLAPAEDKRKKKTVSGRQADTGSAEATDGTGRDGTGRNWTGGEVEQQQAEGPEGRSRSRHGETESFWSVFTELGDRLDSACRRVAVRENEGAEAEKNQKKKNQNQTPLRVLEATPTFFFTAKFFFFVVLLFPSLSPPPLPL